MRCTSVCGKNIRVLVDTLQCFETDNSILNLNSSKLQLVIGDNNVINGSDIIVIGDNNKISGDKIVCIGKCIFEHVNRYILLNPKISITINDILRYKYENIVDRELMMFYIETNKTTKYNHAEKNILLEQLDLVEDEDLDTSTCVVCFVNKPNIALNCGHCYCSSCTKTIIRNDDRCPECRINIEEILRIYV